MAARRPVFAAALFYALLAVAMVAPALIPGHTLASTDLLWSLAPWTADTPPGVPPYGSNYELADAVAYFQPALEYTRSRLPEMPLWNPHIEGGRPFHASIQPAVFSPFSWPAYVLPFWWSLGVIGALKLWVPAFGTFLLARALGQSHAGALLAGVVAGFGLFHVVWLAWPLSSVWAWLPWLLLLTDRVVRRPGRLPVVGLAVVVAVQYTGGHPETSFHVLAATLAFALLRMQGWRGLLRFGIGALAGTALAAAVLLPFLELLYHSSDLANRKDREPARSPLRYLLSVALPDFWGRPTQLVSEPFIVARAFYAGALPLLLAACALVLKPTRERLIIAAAGAVALTIVVGVEPFFTLIHLVPGFSMAHNTRLAIIALLAVALLAGWGLDSLRPSRWLLPLAVGVLVLPIVGGFAEGGLRFPLGDALASAWGFVTPTDPAVLPLTSMLIWVPFALLAGVLVVKRPAHLATLAVTLTVLDLFRAGMGQNPAIPVDHATVPFTPAMRELANGRFVAVGGELLTPLTANVGMRFGLHDARGYDYPTEKRYDELWRRAVNPPDPLGLTLPSVRASAGPEALRALGLLNVTRILQPPDEPALSLPRVYAGPDAVVYANPRATPRTYVAGSERVVEDQLTAVLESGPEAVVSEPLGLDGSGTARITRDDPEHVAVRSDTRGRAMVVLADTYFPGWKATVDGADAPIIRTQHLLRGVVVPAGTHTVEFRYAPLSWRIGWIVSLLTALALVGVAWRR
ncbi:YfhO family protein [Solirubrobacter sp. CPCC 204708]|uniref:YfhO family protein n=1 Tax=Solirubrobacter deserti TaxID=2282478 RepID=A0ABT4RSF8_9ACTN|nr:YfhO family protein [Solirubrobacter deserti]MBE2316392.1 YfhO family protein [Solirubrobacter deserti]MDA0141528.1 YfhO family protein [Solirubrobacter deserti]